LGSFDQNDFTYFYCSFCNILVVSYTLKPNLNCTVSFTKQPQQPLFFSNLKSSYHAVTEPHQLQRVDYFLHLIKNIVFPILEWTLLASPAGNSKHKYNKTLLHFPWQFFVICSVVSLHLHLQERQCLPDSCLVFVKGEILYLVELIPSCDFNSVQGCISTETVTEIFLNSTVLQS
jgi:hypothetical protein